MGKISKKLRILVALFALCGLATAYQNCGPSSGTSPFDITLGSQGPGTGPVINTTQVTNKLALGYEHSCGINTSGGVECWGAGSQGELGYGALVTYSLSPVTVTGLPAAVAKISSGNYFTCA